MYVIGMAMISKRLIECNNYDSSAASLFPCKGPIHGIGNLTLAHLFHKNQVENGGWIRGSALYVHGLYKSSQPADSFVIICMDHLS
jgi:hypothetical protein